MEESKKMVYLIIMMDYFIILLKKPFYTIKSKNS